MTTSRQLDASFIHPREGKSSVSTPPEQSREPPGPRKIHVVANINFPLPIRLPNGATEENKVLPWRLRSPWVRRRLCYREWIPPCQICGCSPVGSASTCTSLGSAFWAPGRPCGAAQYGPWLQLHTGPSTLPWLDLHSPSAWLSSVA